MRTKIIAGNVVAVLLVGLVSYFVVSGQIRGAFVAQVDQEIVNDHRLFEQIWRLSTRELVDQAVDHAAAGEVRDVFSALDESGQRDRAFRRATQIAELLGRRNRDRTGPPEVVAITDERGRVIARSQDRNRMFGLDLTEALPSLTELLQAGAASSAVWRYSAGQDKLLQTAMAPIRDANGQILGALVVGYDMSNGMASRMAQPLGREVAFLSDDGVYSSSLPGDRREALGRVLFTEQQEMTQQALGGSGASERWYLDLAGQQYVGITAPLPRAGGTLGYAVMANRSAQAAQASVANVILIMTGLGLVLVLIYGFLVGSSFLKPLAEMEEGVLAVINGRTDLRLDIESAELGGLAYRINQLLNVFTGTPEEDEEGRVSSPPEAWGAEGAAEAKPAAGGEPEDPALAAELAEEPEDAYYARVYGEYVAAKEAAGENVSNITQERFVQALEANEKSLMEKHDCRMVRFQVQTRGNQVNLRPVIIR